MFAEWTEAVGHSGSSEYTHTHTHTRSALLAAEKMTKQRGEMFSVSTSLDSPLPGPQKGRRMRWGKKRAEKRGLTAGEGFERLRGFIAGEIDMSAAHTHTHTHTHNTTCLCPCRYFCNGFTLLCFLLTLSVTAATGMDLASKTARDLPANILSSSEAFKLGSRGF